LSADLTKEAHTQLHEREAVALRLGQLGKQIGWHLGTCMAHAVEATM
jgi:hypothetical protein